MKISRTSVGLAVRSARMAANLTAADLAMLTGISTSSVSRTESGQRDLEFREALAIAKVLGIEVSVLQDLSEVFEREGAGKAALRISELEHDLLQLQREAINATIALSSHGAS